MVENWDGMAMQSALLGAELVYEDRLTDAGGGWWYYLKVGTKLIPLGADKHFADMLVFALRRNAKAFEHETHPPQQAAEAATR